jgi:TPR repeat protein
MVQLGGLLETGRGVPGDFRKSFALYQIASKAGFKPATEKLDALRRKLTPDQLKAAEAFAASTTAPTRPAEPAAKPAADPAPTPAKKPAATKPKAR